MNAENDTLVVHVDLDQIRHVQLENRINSVETKLEKIDTDLSMVKDLLTQDRKEHSRILFAALALIITTLLGVLGLVFLRLLA